MTVPFDSKTFEFVMIVQTAILAKVAFPLKERDIDNDMYNSNTAAVHSARDLRTALAYIEHIPDDLSGQQAALDYISHVFEGEPAAHWMRLAD